MIIPYATPLSPTQLEQFLKLTQSLEREQIAWLSGYLAALSRQGSSPEVSNVPPAQSVSVKRKLTVLYGSRTGNGAGLAAKAKAIASEVGLEVLLKNMEEYNPRELSSEEDLLIIVSTHGEGEPPFAAKELHQFLHSKRAPKLTGLNYAVMALGDSSYFHFCQTGIDFDLRLENLGANRWLQMAAFDVDFAAKAEAWLRASLPGFGGVTEVVSNADIVSAFQAETNDFSKTKPYQAEIVEKINLNGRGSDRQTLHLELVADLDYEPGDAAGIIPVNESSLVKELLDATRLDPLEAVVADGHSLSLQEALTQVLEISKITADVVKRYLELSNDLKLRQIVASQVKLQKYLYGRDVLDVLMDFPIQLTGQQLVNVLRPLQPRLYSISSSPVATPGELHLTVGVVEYEKEGRNRRGTCSGYLSFLNSEAQKVPVFIQKNPDFRLPANSQTPIIMVGAGTGIAPYRAFIQHREKSGNPGKSWLFFGNRNFENEFLYQTEWQKFLKSGALTQMHVAFSRDSDQRTYVQHRLAENAAEVFRWLEEGAHFYICGDMNKMATDVRETLLQIVAEQGKKSKKSAAEYLHQLQKEKRLQLDVY